MSHGLLIESSGPGATARCAYDVLLRSAVYELLAAN